MGTIFYLVGLMPAEQQRSFVTGMLNAVERWLTTAPAAAEAKRRKGRA